nr:MAG TPA: portal protein [Caudoviricetes sp.]
MRQNPLYRILRYRPNPLQAATYFWADMEMSRNHYGNAYAAIFGHGANTQLWHMRSDRVSVWFDNRRILGPDARLWYIWSAPDGKRYKLCQDEVLHFRTWLSLDGITGLSVQEILQSTLDGSLQSQQMLNSLYKNGFTAKAAVQYTGDLNSEAEQNFLRGLEAYATGKMDATKTFIPVPLGSKIEPLNIKLTDSQFIELRKHSALQIAAAFGVKPNQVNDYEKSSFANSESQQLAFLTDTLLWILKGYEEELSWKLLEPEQINRGEAAQFNTAVMLRADTKTQIESMVQAVANSVYMPNEARAYLGMASAPGGDRLIANGNIIPLEDVGKQYGSREE